MGVTIEYPIRTYADTISQRLAANNRGAAAE